MKKMNNRGTFRFLFKLIILFQLYSHLKLATEAAQLSQIRENVDQTNGNHLNHRMSQIEAKSQRQENEISFLKTTVVEDKRIIRQLRGRVSGLESLMLTKNPESNEKLLMRSKRPYRLLPLHPTGGEVRDKAEKEKAEDNTRFYGPASNCKELGKLGYTLHGYYLVKGKAESKSNSIEAVFCQFKLPDESKGGADEERLGFITIDKNVEKSQTHNEEKNIPLVNSQLQTDKNELKVTDRNLFGLIKSSDSTTTAKPPGNRSPITIGYRFLVNGFGKGMTPYGGKPSHGSMLLHWKANATSWSWNEATVGSGDRHLCNEYKKCATSSRKDPSKPNETPRIRQKNYTVEEAQRFNFLDLPAYPGFFLIKDEFETCVGIFGNRDSYSIGVSAMDCNPLEAGQRWKWIFP